MADTLAVKKRLTASGFSEMQAEAMVEAIADMRDDLATRSDLQAESAALRTEMAALRSDMQAGMAEFRTEMTALRSDMTDLRSDMQEMELRLTIRIGAAVGAASIVTVGVLGALIALL